MSRRESLAAVQQIKKNAFYMHWDGCLLKTALITHDDNWNVSDSKKKLEMCITWNVVVSAGPEDIPGLDGDVVFGCLLPRVGHVDPFVVEDIVQTFHDFRHFLLLVVVQFAGHRHPFLEELLNISAFFGLWKR